jgi:hypothetical protein
MMSEKTIAGMLTVSWKVGYDGYLEFPALDYGAGYSNAG